MREAIRFPDDYDGIIAGAPAFQFMEMAPWMVAMDRAQSVHPLDRDALRVLDRNSLARCDALDGVEDGVVSDPQACTVERLQLNALLCGANGQSDCLTEGQIQTAWAVYEPVRNAAGEVVSPPVPPGVKPAVTGRSGCCRVRPSAAGASTGHSLRQSRC